MYININISIDIDIDRLIKYLNNDKSFNLYIYICNDATFLYVFKLGHTHLFIKFVIFPSFSLSSSAFCLLPFFLLDFEDLQCYPPCIPIDSQYILTQHSLPIYSTSANKNQI